MLSRLYLTAAMAVLVATPHTASGQEPQPPQDAPAGVEILLPRGAIGAVFEPQFVDAAEAEIPDDAWVLGVVINGEAHAYSLNLLNHHEVVNDRFGELPVAAVW